MLHNSDVERQIQDMGYILATPIKSPMPSLYKLDDGTILTALIKVNHILTGVSRLGTGAVNHSTDIRVFAPSRNKAAKHMRPDQPPTIIDQDIQCTPLREEFNDYAVGANIIVSTKAVVGQVAKTDLHSEVGEPVYNINVQPVIKIVDKSQQPFAPDMR